MALPEAITYDRAGRVTEIEQELKQVPGALFTVRNMLGVDPDGGGVPDATETVKGKAELATVAEAIEGTDTTRIVTPEGLAAAIANTARGVSFPVRFTTVAEITLPTVLFGAISSALVAVSNPPFSYPPDGDCYTTFCFHIAGSNNAFFLSRLGTGFDPTFEYPYIDAGVTALVAGVSMPISIPATTLITVWNVIHTPLVGP